MTRIRWTLLAAYLALQVTLPLSGLLRDKPAARGDFSWNMYADSYRCSVLYTFREADGRIRSIDHRAYFRDAASAGKVFHRDRLPAFHAFLCDDLNADGSGRLEGLVSCSTNAGPWLDLIEPGVDLCGAPNRGVR